MSGAGPGGGGNGGSSSSDDSKSGGPRKKLKEILIDPDFPSTDEDGSDMSVSPGRGKASGSELSPPSTNSVPSGKAETSTGASSSFPSSDHVNTAGSRPIQGSPPGAPQGALEPSGNSLSEQEWLAEIERVLDDLEKEEEVKMKRDGG